MGLSKLRKMKQIKYKKSITLMEVLISLVILSAVIVASIDIQNKGLNFYQKMNSSLKESSVISTTVFETKASLYLSDLFKFKDDLIDKKLKKYKLKIDNEQLHTQTIEISNITPNITTMRRNIRLDESVKKSFYIFKLDLQ